MKKRNAFLIVMLILLIIPVGLFGLISTETGSNWLLRTIFSVLSAQVSVATIEGRLLDRISLTDFRYQTAAETIAINNLALTWQPYKLFSGTLKIVDVAVNGLNVGVSDAKEPQEKSTFDLNAELLLPVQIVIENFLLTDMQFQQGDFAQTLKKLQLALVTEGDQLKIKALSVNAEPVVATLKGQMTLGKGFPFTMTSDWQANAGQNGVWQGSTTITGDINKLSFDNQTSAPFKIVLKGYLDDLQTKPRITSHADWNKAAWPVTGAAPQIKSEQGTIELTGLLDDYQVTLDGQLTQQYLPGASLAFKGKGNQNALSIEKLSLTSKTGLFQVNGNVSWQGVPAFDLTATGQNFNPAILHPGMPGNLTFNSHLKGKLDAKALQIDADINKLFGQLRGHPVSANGKLVLNGDQLKVDGLHINSGTNKIAVNGTMGYEQAALEMSIDTPDLDAFWPTLDGSLKGEGFMQGTWKSPTVKFKATGKNVRFAEHSVRQLGIAIDYYADTKKTSKILLSASAIKTGELQIDSVRVDGLGTLAKHSFKVDINSVDGDLATAFTGSLNTGNWKSDFSKLDLNSRDLGLWQLKKNLTVNIIQRPSGVDMAFDEACMVQNTASLCTRGRYLASGDLNFSLKATALPTSLMKPYFPEHMHLNGTLNADTEIQKQKGLFTGRYQVEQSPATLSFQGKDIPLGASSLSGKIKGDTLSADIDLALAGQDYVRSQLQMDTDKSQAISGQITASIQEFAILEAFVPQLSGVKGRLTADLNVKGSVKQPLVMGQIELANGTVDIAEQGFGFREINLHANASGGQVNRIQINGSVLPAMLKQADSKLAQLKGLISINADLEQQGDLLAGHYRIESPPLTILLQDTGTITKIPLGASTLSGTINGDAVSAELDFRLVGQDYLRAQLQMDADKTQTLTGRITASVVEFASLNSFVPELSNIKGRLNADLILQGTLKKPVANGAIRFTGGAVDVNELGLALREIKLQILASGASSDRLQITGSAKSGEGVVYLDGFASLQADAGWPVDLTLKGESFEVAKLTEAQIALSPDLNFVFAKNKGKVTGTLKVPKAIMAMTEIPENAIKVSPDEIILGQEKVEEKARAAPQVIDANIDVELGKQVSFSGQGLSTQLSGKLNVVKEGEKMAMHGNIDMIKARYKSYGQDLTVRKGRFVFNGPVDNPWLDVEAIRLSKSKKVTAILSLTGSLHKPETRISSEPALPEAEALAYLITGRPLNQVSKQEGNMLASAALSYGGGRAAWITEKLGIDEFEVQDGETLQDTLVAVGQYLSPDFYVGAKVGLFNKQASMVLKHKITNAINVETQAGTSQRVKINYEIDRD